jgi:hypothetical protein
MYYIHWLKLLLRYRLTHSSDDLKDRGCHQPARAIITAGRAGPDHVSSRAEDDFQGEGGAEIRGIEKSVAMVQDKR